jgi:competence protein ComEC
VSRYPLLPIAVAFAAGIGAAPHFYFTAREQIWLLTVFCAAAALLLWMGRDSYSLVLCWLAFFLCGTFFAAAEHHYLPPNHLDRLVSQGLLRTGAPVEITGWVRSPSDRRPGSETFDLGVEQVQQAGRSLPTSGGIRVYYYLARDRPASLGVRYGTRLTISLKELRPPRNFLTPDSFDWQAYMRRQGIAFTGLIRGPEDLRVLPGSTGSWWQAAIFRLRSRLLGNLDRLYGGESGLSDRGAVLKAMLLGDDGWLSPQIESAFQASGTYHVLVVSGWNVFAFAIPLLWLTARLRLPEWLGAVLVAAAVVCFALLAEGGASVARAALMFLIYLLARFFYRERAVLNSIATAALILLLIHPSDLWNAGFQLSFFAVLVLAVVAVPLIYWIATPYRVALRDLDDHQRDLLLQPKQLQFRDDLRVLLDFLCGPPEKDRTHQKWLRRTLTGCAYGLLWVAEGLLFTGMIQVGLFLATATYFHRLTWSGVFANLIVLPMASGIVVIGLPLLFLSLLWWGAARWIAVALGWWTSALEWVAEHSARWEWLNRRIPAPPPWLAVAFILLLVALAILVARRSRWAWAAASLLAGLCTVLSLAPYQPRLAPGELQVAVLDVGEGDSIFVSYPDGTTMLVDGGGTIPIPGSPPPRLDVGESVVSSYLWSRNIQHLDYVVLTHDHWDHMGGLKAVAENFRVGELWMGHDPADRNMGWLRAIARARGTCNVRVADGIHKSIGGVEVDVLSPPPDWAPRRVSNNDSVVLRLGYKGRHVLLPGDIEARMERRLVSEDEPLSSEVLKVAHHGSRPSSTAGFLEQVKPQFGIISVGAFKRFGLPNDEVIQALHSAGVRVYRTDRDGTTTVSSDGHRLSITAYCDTLWPWPRFAP